jgi:uncharacterized protein
MNQLTVETRHGQANVHLHPAEAPYTALVLGHGAGGGVSAPDLLAATAAALAVGVSVALVEQPYRVAGRRSPAPAHQLDAAWIDVIDQLRTSELRGLRLVVGGRSSGARVACRTAAATGAVGVLCLAFPLQAPTASRLFELDAVSIPVLVVQGVHDRFGMPPSTKLRTVAQVQSDHGLKADLESVAAAIRDWLPRVVPGDG